MTTANAVPASFDLGDENLATGPRGQVAHQDLIAHTDQFERKLWSPRDGVWSYVGNGLSNQNFVLAPGGLIVIDTGESIQEMQSALDEVRTVTDAPIAAVLYTHFHYTGGTDAVLADAGAEIPIWSHEGVVGNRERVRSEVGTAAGRGLVHQFGIVLPTDGPDGVVNVGLGLEFRRADHAPFTTRLVPPTDTFNAPTTATIAGLTVEFTPAPSDADDSITIWFPEIGVCINNLVWPTLFNVFAIRGEEYRDPRILLTGLDHIAALGAEHLLGAHGVPLSGRDRIEADVNIYRDAIQYLWDQTVRGLNRGLTVDELTQFVQLPPELGRSPLTRQFYGLVEHHVRQIHSGLRGWFDGHEALLFPTPPLERARRLIAGFGGVTEVRAQARAALAANDFRWGLELASWLVRSELDETGRIDGGEPEDRALLAAMLRSIAQRTTSSNARNWCLTRALELEGTLDLRRFRTHRFSPADLDLDQSPADFFTRSLRVLIDPQRAEELIGTLRWEFTDGSTAGMAIRRRVALTTDGVNPDVTIKVDRETWTLVLGNKTTLDEAVTSGALQFSGDENLGRRLLASFDLPSLRS